MNAIHTGPGHSLAKKATHRFPNLVVAEENDHKACGQLLNLGSVEQSHSDCLAENPISDSTIHCKVDRLFSPNSEVPECCTDTTSAEISAVTLQTFIVGRRFSDERMLSFGMSIFLLRDPANIKDRNAIKVLSADSGVSKVLGYLPRELAQYLSPLIEKYCLNFEGRVAALPKYYPEVVPIDITCNKMTSNDDKEYKDFGDFKVLWEKVLQVVESQRKHPPTMMKYQQNFNLVINEVLGNNSHLFTADEKDFLESLTSASEDSQRLFIRLYTRKGPWFRLSRISYPEVLDSQKAVGELIAIGMICPFEDGNELHDNDMKHILDLLNVFELRDILSMLKKNFDRGSRKQDLIGSLLSSYEDGLCPLLPSLISDKTGFCVRISSQAESLVWRAERLFFLNGEQDLSSFVLVNMGIVKYPSYKCIITERIFSCQVELLAYEEAIEVAQIMDQSLDKNEIDMVLRCITIADSHISSSYTKEFKSRTSKSVAAFSSRFTASWVYSKVALLGISFLERERRYNDAVYLLRLLLDCLNCDGRRGYWILRLSVDLEHMDLPNESLSVAENGLLDPWVRAGSRMALQRRILRLGKPPRRWKTPSFSDYIKRKIPEVHIQGRPLNCETGTKSRFYGDDGEQCGVEQLALQYYAGEGGGWQGVHSESGIWLTIFGLLMWDILFSDVPNVFRTKFQTAPLDLETDGFYLTRESLIESHLKKINDGMAEEMLITSWELHLGTNCRGVHWERHSLSELRAAVTCIGGPCLSSLCRHLAQDYKSWSSGMPDLLLWRFHGDYRGEAKLVEVKGPRDRLSEQQRAWLLLLMDCGFNTEVCKVSPLPLST